MPVTKGNKNKKVAATEAASTLEAVRDLDLTTVIGEVGSLQVTIQNALAGLSTSLTGKIQQLETVDQAIALKQDRLQELYEIEKEAVAIDDLRAQREEESKEWQRKKIERDVRWDEERSDREKSLKRETEEYLYTTKQNQKRIKDEFETEVSRQKREEQVRQELLQRQWEQRETDLETREQEVVVLKEQVAGFDARLKADVAKAEAVVGNTVKRQFEHEIALIRKDAETSQKMSAAHVQMQQQTITGLQDQIKDLQTQLASARSDAKDIASTALQSASGRQVVEALQRAQDSRDNASKVK